MNYKCPECGSDNTEEVFFQGPSRLICNDCDWWNPGFGEMPIKFDKPEPIEIER